MAGGEDTNRIAGRRAVSPAKNPTFPNGATLGRASRKAEVPRNTRRNRRGRGMETVGTERRMVDEI